MALLDSDNDDDDVSWQKNHGKIKHAWRWRQTDGGDQCCENKLHWFNGLEQA